MLECSVHSAEDLMPTGETPTKLEKQLWSATVTVTGCVQYFKLEGERGRARHALAYVLIITIPHLSNGLPVAVDNEVGAHGVAEAVP
jgi:hypothetical protein